MKKFQINKDEFIINDYNRAKPFASFLPGIAGVWGKPLWVFYVNRGQCISSFGTKDKDGAITEFRAANKAYRTTSLQGFRTFLKIVSGKKNKYYEPFQSDNHNTMQSMHIKSGSIKLRDINSRLGLKTDELFFTLPNENVPALIKILEIKNVSDHKIKIEALDGLPVIQPYGIDNSMLKNVSRLAEGWFSGVLLTPKNRIPVYKLAVKAEDAARVVPVKEANFYCAFYNKNSNNTVFPPVILEAEEVFGHHTDFVFPVKFNKPGSFSFRRNVLAKNKSASAMSHVTTNIEPGGKFILTTVIGKTGDVSLIDRFADRISKNGYISEKLKQNKNLLKKITHRMFMKSSSESFDLYAQQTYLDNVLRGGYPVSITVGEKKVTEYIYSRIHGDMEREYNNFVITPSYFSQGTGNYRDVCQNRRNDVLFNPDLKFDVLKSFLNLVQLDGFNPLKIKESRYYITSKTKLKELRLPAVLEKFLTKSFTLLEKHPTSVGVLTGFTLGELFTFIETNNIKLPLKKEGFLSKILSVTSKFVSSEFSEGYWSDHWHYNTDLLENFLSVYPDIADELLFKRRKFTFYDTHIFVKKRSDKYVLWRNKIRQLDVLFSDENKLKLINARRFNKNVVRTRFGQGKIYHTTLLIKLLSIIANKYASLDPFGTGIEMEAGKPNWCDALNGLPGLFGSSLCETFELKRLIKLVLNLIEDNSKNSPDNIVIPCELSLFLKRLKNITLKYNKKIDFWDKTHSAKENFRKQVFYGISGQEEKLTIGFLTDLLELFKNRVSRGIKRAKNKKTGLYYSYFINEVTKFSKLKSKNSKGLPLIKPLYFKQEPLPYYLEGIVHCLKTGLSNTEAKSFYSAIKKSELYDNHLKMYKINAPLDDAAIDIGRAKIFTPGWLENESVWLHMQYKYLLELLRSGLYTEFYNEIKHCLVPFMDPAVYGRSPMENVSFIVSSAHPDKKLWGNGFVARLSGATAEFVNIWCIMTAGEKPFISGKNRKVELKFTPRLHAGLFTLKKSSADYFTVSGKKIMVNVPVNSLTFSFLGRTLVTYINPERKSTFGSKSVKPVKYTLYPVKGKKVIINNDRITEPWSLHVRNGEIKKIEVKLD